MLFTVNATFISYNNHKTFSLYLFLSSCFPCSNGQLVRATDKETDESWDIFIIWKINSRLVWAPGPVLWKKVWGRLLATFEVCFFTFSWAKNKFNLFWKYSSACTENLHRGKKVKKNLESIFFTEEKPVFL